MITTTLQDLLDAGVHFGHQTRRWNPRSKPFIFDHRQGISIIDLEKTHAGLVKACAFLTETVAAGGLVLLVGTKRQAADLVKEAATSTNMPYCVNRWLGGTLTNFETVKKSLARYRKLQGMENDGSLAKMLKKEAAMLKREMARMQRNFEGVLELNSLPAALFVVDTKTEAIAVAEAIRCQIPVVGLVDTNSDPSLLQYPIPGNDDAVKSIRVILDTVVAALQEGVAKREERKAQAKAAPTRVDFRPAAAEVQPGIEGVTYTLPTEMQDLSFTENAPSPASTGMSGAPTGPRRPAGSGPRRSLPPRRAADGPAASTPAPAPTPEAPPAAG